jgi:hypothetical protein
MTNTDGFLNTAYGMSSLMVNTQGAFNTALGQNSLVANTLGNSNVAIGMQSGYANTTGSGNVAIGSNAMQGGITGSNNTCIGNGTSLASDPLTNATVIGYAATVNASNKVRIGNSSVLVIEGQVAYTFPSDGRFKTNVKENVPGLEFIMKLRPVTYTFQTRKYDQFMGRPDSMLQQNASSYGASERIVHTGFIAQEVEKVANETNFDFDAVHIPTNEKDNYGLAYSEFTVPLVKAVQEQQKTITDLQKQVTEQQQQLAELMQWKRSQENKK